jgi:hypothetical protein
VADDGYVVPEVAPHPGTVRTAPVAFSSATAITGGAELDVRFVGGLQPCFVLDHVTVDEGADVVVVTLYAGHDPSVPHVACSKARRELRTVVALRAPLGDRTVLDGAAGTEP